MRKRISLILLTLLIVFSGCKSECETDKNDFEVSSAVLIPNPYFMEKDILKTITEIVVEMTKLIPDAHFQGEVEQTTLIIKSTTSAQMTDVVEQINRYRAESNLSRLKTKDSLLDIARIRAKEVSQKWSHTRSNGQKLDSFLDNSEWTIADENLAKHRNATNTDVVDAWKRSESHRANLLNSRYEYCGIAEYYDGEFRYISIIFIG